MTRLAQLHADLDVAKLAEDTAEVRVRWCKQQLEVDRAQEEEAAAHSRLAEARLEQARAHLADRHGRRPSGRFNITTFDQQANDAARDYEKSQRNVMAQSGQSSRMEGEYGQTLSQYSERRRENPSFSSSYTPPGYRPPQPRAEIYVPGS